MAAPPPKSKEPTDLAEVERALSVLQGRHPEHERIRREDAEKRIKRQADIDAKARAEARRILTRRLTVIASVIAVVTAAVSVGKFLRAELAWRGRIERVAERYREMGFTVVDSSSRSEPSKLVATAPAGCILAVSTKSTTVRIAHPGGEAHGTGSVMTCICENAQVTVTGPVEAGEGLVLLRADAGMFGGSRAFAFLPFEVGAAVRADQACAESSLDAWIDSQRWSRSSSSLKPASSADGSAVDRWLSADPRRSVLGRAGLKVVATVLREVPFSILEVPADTCVLISSDHPRDKISLRLKGGALAVGPVEGSAGWCTSKATLLLAQHEGEGEAAVLFGPSSRVGGLVGMREIGASAGLPLSAATVAEGDSGWNAKQLLLASAIPATLISVANAPDLGVDVEARIVSLSLERENSFVPETPPDVFSFCDPPLGRSMASLCVFSGSQKWRLDGADAAGGMARSKLPFWLFGLQGVNEPVALKLEADLVSLARKLRRQGFEPTTLDAVTELDRGAEVLGRANEDAMVVVGLAPTAPWVFPYTDGPGWSIDGDPRIIPIKPLERMTVTSPLKKLPPKAARRTVVFRRQKQ